MISAQEAINLILKTTSLAGKLNKPIEQCYGKILAQNIYAFRAHPAFDRVMMDGIAISNKTQNRFFKIEDVQRAGSAKLTLKDHNSCIEVMTGSSLPCGCDIVIPYEEIKIKDGIATIKDQGYQYKDFIHKKESDYKKDQVLVPKGTRITSTVLGIIASQGISEVEVFSLPKISIISSGNELKELNEDIQEHQIYKSNPYAIESELKNFNDFEIQKFHIQDDLDETIEVIQKALNSSDIIILSGGVSKGKFDFIPTALEKLKVEKIFHRVSQRPGKPLYYGKKDNKQIFALPGNPVSSLVCLRVYVLSSLEKRLGFNFKKKIGILTKEITFKNDLTYFVSVKESFSEDGKLLLEPILTNTSGDFNSLCHSTGLIELPKDRQVFSPGESFTYYPWN